MAKKNPFFLLAWLVPISLAAASTGRSRTRLRRESTPRRRSAWSVNCCPPSGMRASSSWQIGSRCEGRSSHGLSSGAYSNQGCCCYTGVKKPRWVREVQFYLLHQCCTSTLVQVRFSAVAIGERGPVLLLPRLWCRVRWCPGFACRGTWSAALCPRLRRRSGSPQGEEAS